MKAITIIRLRADSPAWILDLVNEIRERRARNQFLRLELAKDHFKASERRILEAILAPLGFPRQAREVRFVGNSDWHVATLERRGS